MVGHIGGRQTANGGVPPELPPIPRERLAAAYAERQADSDYGFQKEFEVIINIRSMNFTNIIFCFFAIKWN